MFKIPDSAGSSSDSETSGEIGSYAEATPRKTLYQDLIRRADSVPLTKLFSHYNIRVDRYNRKITCPFKSHKNGRESTASFYYYPETNSFRCYGCNMGNPGAHSVELVSVMEGISRYNAALKIIDLFSVDVNNNAIFNEREDYTEKLEIMMDFSNAVKEFRNQHNDAKSEKFIEDMCRIYDDKNARLKLNNNALRHLVESIKFKISIYV